LQLRGHLLLIGRGDGIAGAAAPPKPTRALGGAISWMLLLSPVVGGGASWRGGGNRAGGLCGEVNVRRSEAVGGLRREVDGGRGGCGCGLLAGQGYGGEHGGEE
jgi:hypothetical protein